MLETQTDERTPPRSEVERTGKRKARTRTLVSYIPVTAAALGITLVIGSVVLIYGPNDLSRLWFVTFGLGILVVGIWFAAHPFFKSSRRFTPLRREVEAFMGLVQALNRQAAAADAREDIESTKARMHEAVERIVAQSGKQG